MHEKRNHYALAALKNKRATLSSEIVQLDRQIRSRKESLAHVDACLRLFDPTLCVDDIPNKRLPKHANLYRCGELGRLILGTLREAEGRPLPAPEIVAAIMRKNRIDSSGRGTIRVRVRANLAYLQRRGKVAKVGERAQAKWSLG